MRAAEIQVVWYKRDLRVRDHLALALASERGPVIALYVCEPHVVWNSNDHDPRHWGFVRECLIDLNSSLTNLGSPLVIRVGNVVDVLEQLRVEHNVSCVWAHEETGNYATFQRDIAVHAWAQTHRIEFNEIPQHGVVRRLRSRNEWSREREKRLRHPVPNTPQHIHRVPNVHNDQLPEMYDATSQFRQTGGETIGQQTLDDFLRNTVTGYERHVSSPLTAWTNCSRISPHLAYGTLSARQIISRVRQEKQTTDPQRAFSLDAFESRLAWRDHFMQKLETRPEIEWVSYVQQIDELRSKVDQRKLEAWTTGTTGYPFVDACLRAVAQTGWMNFRMRAMLVSFASYDLWLPWQSFGPQLARWFVDYEPGIHWSQVQMQSGSTLNNEMRVYNPIKQSYDQDPTGEFIRTWVPELSSLSVEVIHEPWKHPEIHSQLRGTYSAPIVDHMRASTLAVQKIKTVRRSLQSGRR